jgi:Tol biopolymer transport system component
MNKTRLEKVSLACTVVFAVVLVGVVQISLLFLLISLSSLLMVRPAFGQSNASQGNAGVRLEAGIAKEEADGDLKAAMTVYRQIADDASASRAVRAKALLRLARCDEKLGRQARQLYEQIVRDYADQPVAGQARSRLAAMKQQDTAGAPTTMTARRIDGHSVGHMGASDTDGQRAVYRDADGSLYFGDLAGRKKSLVFKASAKETVGWVPSRDFSLVALELPDKGRLDKTMLAVIKTDGTGYRELIDDGMVSHGWFNWSWDNRFLVISSDPKKGVGRLLLVSIADGKQRELFRAQDETEVFTKAVISPNGRFVAYELTSKSSGHRAIFVMPIDGGERHLVYEPAQPSSMHSALLDWTKDSENLIVSDVRGMSSGVFLLSIKNGVASGVLQKIHQGSVASGWMSASGTLVYQDRPVQAAHGSKFLLTSLDAEGHVGRWDRVDVENESEITVNGNGAWPSFSPDSQEIAYTIRDDRAGYLIVRNVSNGLERVVYTAKEALFCHYGSQASNVFCTEPLTDGHTNILSISSESGAAQLVGSVDGFAIILRSNPSDSSLYLGRGRLDSSGKPQAYVGRWDNAARREDVVTADFAIDGSGSAPVVSLKCNLLVKLENGDLLARPMTGGDWKKAASIKGAPERRQFVTTADEKWIIYHDVDGAGKDCLFRVPIAGGTPELVGDFPGHDFIFGSLQVSPDGSRILADVPADKPYDLWVLSNFTPKR